MDLSGRISSLFRERKSRTLLIIGVIALLIPLMIYYILDVRSVFDGRSRAGTVKLPDRFKIADLNTDNKVDLDDFSLWAGHFQKSLK